MFERKIVVEVHPSPEELAFEFSIMNDEQQATFFNELAWLVDTWEKPFCFQLQSLIDNDVLTDEGRRIMEAIGEYGEDH